MNLGEASNSYMIIHGGHYSKISTRKNIPTSQQDMISRRTNSHCNVLHKILVYTIYLYNNPSTSSATAKLLVNPGLSIANRFTNPSNPSSFTI